MKSLCKSSCKSSCKFFALRIVIGMLVGSAAVMLLWNCVLTVVLSLKSISYLQALGILALSKILFGRCCKKSCCSKQEKTALQLENLSPEEREKYLADMQNENCCKKS